MGITSDIRKGVLVATLLMCVNALGASGGTVRGDINGDGKLTVEDSSKLCAMLVGEDDTEQTDFNTRFDSDNSSFTIADVTSLLKMILEKKEGGMDVGIDGWDDSGEDWGGTVSSPWLPRAVMAAQGNIYSVELRIDYNSYNGFQFKLNLPEGCQLVMPAEGPFSFAEGLDANSELHYHVSPSGIIMVGGYTLDNSGIKADQTVLTFQVSSAAEDFDVSQIRLDNVILSRETDCSALPYDVSVSGVDIIFFDNDADCSTESYTLDGVKVGTTTGREVRIVRRAGKSLKIVG